MHELLQSLRQAVEAASREVGTVMHEFTHGTLSSEAPGKKMTSSKPAVAICLSEARKEGAQVLPRKRTSS
jgi:hypothetical protein